MSGIVPIGRSGQVVLVSGQPVTVSGNAIYVYISGGSIPVNLSGASLVVDISGEPVNISGNVVDISGQSISIVASPPTIFWQSGNGVLFTSGAVDQPRFLDHVEYTATSGTTTSSEFIIKHITSNGGMLILFSLDMSSGGVFGGNVFSFVFIPDGKMVLGSGDAVSAEFPNPEGCDFFTQTVLR